MLGWGAETLAERACVGVATIRRAEICKDKTDTKPGTAETIVRTLEKARVMFSALKRYSSDSSDLQLCLKWHNKRARRVEPNRDPPSKPVRWIGSSLDDLKEFPKDVQRRVRGALWDTQIGRKAPFVKPLKGFGGASVLEIVDDFDGDTYRAVYTVRFAGIVYVLHAFQKKSKRGIATPKSELDLIEQRLKRAK